MNQIEIAKKIIENNGNCSAAWVRCDDCPAGDRIDSSCGFDYALRLQEKLDWFKNWLEENEKKEEEIKTRDNCKLNYENNEEKYLSWESAKHEKGYDSINHPFHYTSVVPGIECIEVTKHFNFCRGNAIKYLWRAGEKDKTKEIEDLKKAIKYIEFEIKRIEEK